MNKTNIFYDEAKQNILWWIQEKFLWWKHKKAMVDPKNFMKKTFFYDVSKKKPYKEKYIEIITLISL